MKHKIALIADVHGNETALRAGLSDCMEQETAECGMLGYLEEVQHFMKGLTRTRT